jgi:ADP-heptose:LPS heptosyltransferase
MILALSIKILAYLVLVIGNILRKKRRIDSNRIKTILVNRTDRLGDAAVSLPFLLELNKKFKVTVLTSQYNDPVLKGLLDTEVFTDRPLSLFAAIGSILKPVFCFWRRPRENINPRYDLYLDLVGISAIGVFLKVKADALCRYYAGFNLGPWNLLPDYSAAENPVLFSRRHILDSYRLLLKGALGLDIDIPDHIDLERHLIKPGDFNPRAPYILFNISGGDKFRGPGLKNFAAVLERLDFSGDIVVMDELSQPNLTEFKKYLQKNNLYYLEKDYFPWELAYIAKGASLYIGSDSGITQFLANFTHCIIFFATGSNQVWRPYPGNPYTIKKYPGITVEETETSGGLIKKVIYSPAWCRPCFDIGCSGRYCIKKLDKISVSEEINRTLKRVSMGK